MSAPLLLNILTLIIVCTIATAQPKYLLLNRTPDSAWNQGNPGSITPEFLNQVLIKLNMTSATINPNLYIGEEFVFSLFQTPQDTLLQTLQSLFNASVATKIPISLQLDDENWWQASNLWNFFDKTDNSYNPDNVYNVERYGWNISNVVEIGWRNWGSQIRVIPQQNILSPQILDKYLPILKTVGNALNEWYENTLKPLNLEYLLSVIKVGWEAGVQYNAYYYPNGNALRLQNASNDPKYGLNFTKGLNGGLPLLGYAAANSSGMFKEKMKNNETLNRYDISNITKLYIDTLINVLVKEIGINHTLVGNHVGGQCKPYDNTVPFAAAFSEYGIPGYSFYDTIPQNIDALKIEMMDNNRSDWMAAEWWLSGANNTQKWYNNMNDTLSFMNCHSMAIYNWDNDFENYPAAIAATQQLIHNF